MGILEKILKGCGDSDKFWGCLQKNPGGIIGDLMDAELEMRPIAVMGLDFIHLRMGPKITARPGFSRNPN